MANNDDKCDMVVSDEENPSKQEKTVMRWVKLAGHMEGNKFMPNYVDLEDIIQFRWNKEEDCGQWFELLGTLQDDIEHTEEQVKQVKKRKANLLLLMEQMEVTLWDAPKKNGK